MSEVRYAKIDSTRWHVLQALADDWESPEIIAAHFKHCAHVDISPEHLFSLIKELFENEYIYLTRNVYFAGDAILKELKGEARTYEFWFGRTDIGYQAWEYYFDRYFSDPDEPIVEPQD